MKILSIETSCDETAVSMVEANGGLTKPHFRVLGNSLFSQIEIHKEFGGVFPAMAKREHSKNLITLLEKTLAQSGMAKTAEDNGSQIEKTRIEKIKKILEREGELFEQFMSFAEKYQKPTIDVIAVTAGPGLEPALWVGISFAQALSELWNIPVIGINHMEGHITSVLFSEKMEQSLPQIKFPALALLISGGHTEIVIIKNWGEYKILGQTRDDAVGEAFDKVARLLGLPYPGGPEISRLAEMARTKNIPREARLPRPMIHSGDFDFSFSGLKTAVLYYIRDNGPLSEIAKMDIAREFEDAVVEVLFKKTKQALIENSSKTLIIAGGVVANKKIREMFARISEELSGVEVRIPEHSLSTDNALMIASACYIHLITNPESLEIPKKIIAQGNLSINSKSC